MDSLCFTESKLTSWCPLRVFPEGRNREDVESIVMTNGLCRFGQTRAALLATCLTITIVTPLDAQTPGDGKTASAPSQPGVRIGGAPPQRPDFERCVDVQIGGENAFGCLNDKLKREVDRVNPSMNVPPLDARSADVHVGNANEAAVREQYGSNYGKSVFPFRPAAPSYVPHR